MLTPAGSRGSDKYINVTSMQPKRLQSIYTVSPLLGLLLPRIITRLVASFSEPHEGARESVVVDINYPNGDLRDQLQCGYTLSMSIMTMVFVTGRLHFMEAAR